MSALSPTPSPNPDSAEPAPPTHTARGERLARAVVGWVYRAPYLTLLLCALLTLSAAWGASGLKLKTKIQDLLPASAPSLKASEALSERLGSVDMLVVTLMSEELERVREVLPEVAKELEALPDVRAVRWRQETSICHVFFWGGDRVIGISRTSSDGTLDTLSPRSTSFV